jgi:hypothetical protein
MGFHKGRSWIDQVNTLRIILEHFIEFQSPLYLIFIDFEKAFDSMNRNKMWNAMSISAFWHSFNDMEAKLNDLKAKAQNTGMKINSQKTKQIIPWRL